MIFLKRLGVRFLAGKTRPQRRGEESLSGSSGPVLIRHDGYGSPHVVAQEESDLFFAQGYLHARERLWQMDFNRRFLYGELAEIFGDRRLGDTPTMHLKSKTIADLDHFMRVIGFKDSVDASISLLPEGIMKVVSAYIDGVNRFIEMNVRRLPLEFRVLKYEPSPWRVQDVLMVEKGFALQLSISMPAILAMAEIESLASKGNAKLRHLYPTGDSGEVKGFSSPKPEGAGEGTRIPTAYIDPGGGSNAWAVDGTKTRSGKPILCSDPHLTLGLPSPWMLMRLEIPGWEVRGATSPGSPCVLIGNSRSVAWGVTAALIDDADLYVEKLRAPDWNEVLWRGKWEALETREEEIRLPKGRSAFRKVRKTKHGPLITDVISAGQAPSEALALRWVALDPSGELETFYRINRSRNWKEFLDALKNHRSPALNLIYADEWGNIGHALAGKVPLRSPERRLLPLPGWSGEYEWRGFIPWEEMPRTFNPPNHLVASANDPIGGDAYPYYLSQLWEPPFRGARVRKLLAAKDKLTRSDMVAIQIDVVSEYALELLDRLRPNLKSVPFSEPLTDACVVALLAWNGECGRDSAGAAIFHAFHQRLFENILKPELGADLFAQYAEILNFPILPFRRILLGETNWFPSEGEREAVVRKSFAEAVEWLRLRLGDRIDRWQWGRLHMLKVRHRLFDNLGFEGESFPTDGDGLTINNGYYPYTRPFEQKIGPSLRMCVDFADPDRSFYVLPGGNSGHPRSVHYRDQLALWKEGRLCEL